MPLWQTRLAVRPPISPPSNMTLPAVGTYMPAMQLKVVLLPEPLGPMRPRISPFGNVEGDIAYRRETAELLGQSVDFEHGHASRRPKLKGW